jgi:hypothetical protein
MARVLLGLTGGLAAYSHKTKDRVPVRLFSELLERRVSLRIEERRGDRRRAQIGPQNRSRLFRPDLLDLHAFCLPGARQLDPACRPGVLDPLPLAVRRDEPALTLQEYERDRSRVALSTSTSDDREDMRAFAGEPQPGQRPDEEVEESPERAPAVRRNHRRPIVTVGGLVGVGRMSAWRSCSSV